MKRLYMALVTVTAAVSLFLFQALPARAAGTGWSSNPFSGGGNLFNDSTGDIGILNISKLDSVGLSFIRDFYNDPDRWNHWLVVGGAFSSSSPVFAGSHRNSVAFVRMPNNLDSSYFQVINGEVLPAKAFSCDFVMFVTDSYGYQLGDPLALGANLPDISRVDGSSHVGRKSFSPTAISTTFFPWLVQDAYFENLGLDTASAAWASHLWKGIIDKDGSFIWDDPSLLEQSPPPVSSEPETPSTPDPPPVVSYPDFPTIGPSDNPYVPYDTTVWNQFADFIKRNIGSAVTVGFLILAGLLGIYVITRIVKHYSTR